MAPADGVAKTRSNLPTIYHQSSSIYQYHCFLIMHKNTIISVQNIKYSNLIFLTIHFLSTVYVLLVTIDLYIIRLLMPGQLSKTNGNWCYVFVLCGHFLTKCTINCNSIVRVICKEYLKYTICILFICLYLYSTLI